MGELIPGEKREGGGRVNEGACSRHKEKAGGVDLVPLGISEDANDDAESEEPGGKADEATESESTAHENDG